MALPQDFIKNIHDMLDAAEQCIKNDQLLPAFVLLYSLIDSMAWATSDKAPKKTRENFESWVNVWLLPRLAITTAGITAVDLYGSRCSIVHTLGWESDLLMGGKAKRISYVWGTADIALLRAAIDKKRETDIALRYEDLLEALRSAVGAVIQAAEADAALAARLKEAADKHYGHVPVRRGVQAKSDRHAQAR